MNRKGHLTVGFCASTAHLLIQRRSEPLTLANLVGFLFGTYFGSLMPDILEPAIHSWHRDFCHSWSVAGGGAVLSLQKIPNFLQSAVRPRIKILSEGISSLDVTQDSDQILMLQLEKIFLEFVETAVPAFMVAYLSHLAVDFPSPRGIPLVSRKLGL